MIKGITPRLAEAGKIKIGGLGEVRKKRGGGTFRLPVKFDHFLITTTNRTEAGDLEPDVNLMEGLMSANHGEIRSIPIVLHSDVIDEVFPTTYARYSGRRCACRGDGETAIRREVKDKRYTGESKAIECPCDRLGADDGMTVCKPNGKLYCSIAVPNAAIAGAVHVWRTTSMISIEQMLGSLIQIKAVCGTLRGVPLWLRVRPITVEPPGQGAITVYCCHVELRAADIREVQERALDAAKRRHELGLDDSEYSKMLTLPAHDETSDEESEIANEFYPEDATNIEGDEPTGEPVKPLDALTNKLKSETKDPGDEIAAKLKAAKYDPAQAARIQAAQKANPGAHIAIHPETKQLMISSDSTGWSPLDELPDMSPESGRNYIQELDLMAQQIWGPTKYLDQLDAICREAGVDLEKMSDAEAIMITGLLNRTERPDTDTDHQGEIQRLSKVLYGADWLDGLKTVCDDIAVRMEKMTKEDEGQIVEILNRILEDGNKK